jgi:hypothetical protein
MPRKKPEGPNPFSVKPGQIWEDCDKRAGGRKVTVLLVREDHGYAVVRSQTGKDLRIKLLRFRERSNGYKLVAEPAVAFA